MAFTSLKLNLTDISIITVNNILFQKYNYTIKISVTDVLFEFKLEDELRCIKINKIMGVGKCVLASSDTGNIQILLVYYIQSFK